MSKHSCVVAYPQPLDHEAATRLAELFNALGDPTRVRIIAALRAGEVSVTVLAEALAMSQSAISHQLRVLRHLHLVRTRKEGRCVYYALDDEHVLTLFEQGVSHIQHIE